jgi:hypothetical protein
MKTIKELEEMDLRIMGENYVKSHRWPGWAARIFIVLCASFVAGLLLFMIYSTFYVLFNVIF